MDTSLVKQLLERLELTLLQIDSVNRLASERGCVDGVIIGTGRSDYTQGSTMYNLKIENRKFALIDIPGIEGDESSYETIIKKSLEQAHLIFYVNGSGKKIEKESLLKIKKYMHDGTSVYAVFNTHCKAKKERVEGIDKSYSEELHEAYKRQKSIINQTEDELISFLGSNYKGSISLNGLLAFCSVAVSQSQRTSIKNEEDKSLRADQQKYLHEYKNDREQMIIDSHLQDISDAIEGKVKSFENDILDENIKKLKNRMNEMLEKISFLKTREVQKINGFLNIYKEFEDNCYNAKEDFIRTMRHVAFNAATEAFYDLMNELFDRIEKDEGKTNSSEIQNIVVSRRDAVVASIQEGVNLKIERARTSFSEAIEEAQERMRKDFEREQIQFEVCLSSDSVELDSSFADALKYNLKDFGKHAFTVGRLALSGAGIGTLICQGLGTAIGAGIGAVLGVLSSIWNFFLSKRKRIDNAKSKIQHAIDEQIDEITEQLNEELSKMDYENKINEVYESLCDGSKTQQKALLGVKQLISSVENELMAVYKNIA